MAEQIYHLNESGQLEPMNEESFDLEDRLQELVAENPSLLSGEQMNPESPRRFILIGREQGIADIIGGSNRWALDHLLIDQDAIPTLVEAKRSSNSQIRREIVGQMMDYAAHATQTWNIAEIRQAFEGRAANADAELAELLGEEADAEEFWQKVEINLRAKRLRLLFVADGIPDELTRVVEFLNEQMPGIEVLAVEIKQFKGVSGATLVPRVIGRTSEAIAVRGRRTGEPAYRLLTPETLADTFSDVGIKRALRRLFEVVGQYDVQITRGRDVLRILGHCRGRNTRYYLVTLYSEGIDDFWFGVEPTDGERWESLTHDVHQLLDYWLGQFENENFATDWPGRRSKGWRITPEAAAENIDLLCERLDRVLRELAELEAE